MAIKKQPESNADYSPGVAHDWFQQFQKHLELHFADLSERLPDRADTADFQLVALKAVIQTIADSGMDDDAIVNLFGQACNTTPPSNGLPTWDAELNLRRFELIDSEIQGTITTSEKLELAGLTHSMRQHVDAEDHLPMAGAKKLHRFLLETKPPDPTP